MKNKIKKYRIKKIIKSYTFKIFVILFFFSLVVGFIYGLPIPQIIDIDSGSLLAYYGTAFGIFASFLTYRLQQKNAKEERFNELKPRILIKVDKCECTENMFAIQIDNIPKRKYLYLYDEIVPENIEEKLKLCVLYCSIKEKQEEFKDEYDIAVDDQLIDSDGYPEYVQILFEDIHGNGWECCFDKIKDGSSIYYYPNTPKLYDE